MKTEENQMKKKKKRDANNVQRVYGICVGNPLLLPSHP